MKAKQWMGGEEGAGEGREERGPWLQLLDPPLCVLRCAWAEQARPGRRVLLVPVAGPTHKLNSLTAREVP